MRGLVCPTFNRWIIDLVERQGTAWWYYGQWSGYHYNANLSDEFIGEGESERTVYYRITKPAQSPWLFDGSGMGMANPYGGKPGGGGTGWADPRYRHNDTINLLMIDGHVEFRRGIHVGENVTVIQNGDNYTFEDQDIHTEVDWSKDGDYYWHYYNDPYAKYD